MKFWTSSRVLIICAVAAATACALPGCASGQKKLVAEKRSGSHLAFARKLIEQGRMREALSQTELAIKESKRNADAWLVQGMARFALGDYQMAIADFNKTLEYDPRLTEALSWRAWARIEAGDLAGAEQDYRAALDDRTYLSPEKIRRNLGLLLMRMGREQEGMEELRRAVTVMPAYALGHYDLGKALEKAGDTNGAIISYQAALGGMKGAREEPDLNLRLALMLEKSGDGARAKEHFKRVIELAPDGPEASTAREHLKRLGTPS